MSLINEALKKAQRMRQDPGSGQDGGEQDSGPALRRGRTDGPPVGLIVGGTLVLLSGVGVLWWALAREPAPPVVAVAPATPAISPAPEPGSIGRAPDSAPPAVTAPMVEPAPELAVVPAPSASSSEPVVAAPAGPTTPLTIEAAPVAENEAAVPPPAIGPNPQAFEFIDGLKIMGVRVSATDPKVLMNDRLYRLNDVVSRPLGLKLTGITSNTLTFTDDAGFTYTRTF